MVSETASISGRVAYKESCQSCFSCMSLFKLIASAFDWLRNLLCGKPSRKHEYRAEQHNGKSPQKHEIRTVLHNGHFLIVAEDGNAYLRDDFVKKFGQPPKGI